MNGDPRRGRLEALYLEHADAVYAYARRRAERAVAEDVVMEVFVVACRRLEEVPDRPLPWLLGCARRVLANQRRGALRADALRDRLRDAAGRAGEDHDEVDMLANALEALDPGDREIITLSAWEGSSCASLGSRWAAREGRPPFVFIAPAGGCARRSNASGL